MLHGIINEQGNCLDVRGDISEKKTIFHTFSNKSLGYGSVILGIIVIAEVQSKGAKSRNRCNQVPHLTQDTNGKSRDLYYRCYK